MRAGQVWQVTLAAMVLVSPFVATDVTSRAVALPVAHEQRPCPGGYVALTFDDGPDAVTTPKLSTELRVNGSWGTFFFIGARAEALPKVVVLARSDGMEVGNHTYDHPFLDELNADQVRQELTSTSRILGGLGGPAPTLFRPPYGRMSPVVQSVVKELGLTEVLWSYDSDDYAEATIPQMVAQAEKATDGEILLFHDGYQSTVDAIPQVLDVFDKRGICTGRVVPSVEPRQAWLDYTGEDRTYYNAKAVRW
jgi:peptidoglycan/xylan/chitin deacetylase (PgdA/CDA1 family)